MIPSFVCRAPRLLACAALFISAGAAYGQVQVFVPSGLSAGSVCSSFVVGANGTTLTCVNPSNPGTLSCGSIVGAPSSAIAAGANVNLQIVCSNAVGTVSYAWTANGSAVGSNSNVLPTQNPQATTTYAVTATDSGGSPSVTKQAQVTVQNGGGGGGGPISCAGYATTRVVQLNWATGGNIIVPSSENDAVVAVFTAGSTPHTSQIQAFEAGSAPSNRLGVLSTSPCDFNYQPAVLGTGSAKIGTLLALQFTVKPATSAYKPALVNGQTYYFNIATDRNTCGTNCQIKIQFSP